MPESPSLWKQIRGSILFWIGGGFLIIGLSFVGLGVKDLVRNSQLARNGESVTATVVSKSIQKARQGGNRRTRYEIHYRFRTVEGRTLENTVEVDVDRWEQLAPGSTLAVTYLPGAPGTQQVDGATKSEFGVIGAILGAVFAGVGGFLFRRTVLGIVRERRLWRVGQRAEATVTEVEETNLEINGVTQWKVRYWYVDHTGHEHQGTSGHLAPAEAHAWKSGARASVLFDPNLPHESLWAPQAVEGSAPAQPTARRGRIRDWLTMAGILLVAIAIGETPLVKAIERSVNPHQAVWLTLTITAAGLGLVVFMGSLLLMLFRERTSQDQFTLDAMVEAWRTGRWREAVWLRRFVTVAGALTMALGLLAIFFVIGPGFIKVLVVGAVLYAIVRLRRGRTASGLRGRGE
ncbi:MAG: DUF3592 domain-containing protein [Bryobacteraceae bacterium]